MKELETFDISLEEFDDMNDTHVFSKEYQQNKKAMLKSFRKNQLVGKRTGRMKIAAACAAVFISTPFVANAAMGGEIFNRIWGNEGKSKIEAHDEVLYDEETGSSDVVTYPAREYEPVDVESAEELVGQYISYPNIVKEINDGTTLTVVSVVRDKNSAILYYTLENENGVDALNYSQLDNEAKGAWFSMEAPFCFGVGGGTAGTGGSIYVDLDKSTDTILHCYHYLKIKGSLDIGLYENPRNEAGEWDLEQADYTNIRVPKPEKIPSVEYVNADGGGIEISPISMTIDMSKGLELTWEEAQDPYNCYYVAINYTDGSKYIVYEEETGKHTCETPIDNTGYVCGGLESDITFVFNRLVEVNEIESITINETEYRIK